MQNKTPAPDPSKIDESSGFLLYNKRPALSENIMESLKKAEAITGVNIGELRMRLVGLGIGALNIKRSLTELQICSEDLQSLDINTGVVAKDFIKKGKLPPPCPPNEPYKLCYYFF